MLVPRGPPAHQRHHCTWWLLTSAGETIKILCNQTFYEILNDGSGDIYHTEQWAQRPASHKSRPTTTVSPSNDQRMWKLKRLKFLSWFIIFRMNTIHHSSLHDPLWAMYNFQKANKWMFQIEWPFAYFNFFTASISYHLNWLGNPLNPTLTFKFRILMKMKWYTHRLLSTMGRSHTDHQQNLCFQTQAALSLKKRNKISFEEKHLLLNG